MADGVLGLLRTLNLVLSDLAHDSSIEALTGPNPTPHQRQLSQVFQSLLTDAAKGLGTINLILTVTMPQPTTATKIATAIARSSVKTTAQKFNFTAAATQIFCALIIDNRLAWQEAPDCYPEGVPDEYQEFAKSAIEGAKELQRALEGVALDNALAAALHQQPQERAIEQAIAETRPTLDDQNVADLRLLIDHLYWDQHRDYINSTNVEPSLARATAAEDEKTSHLFCAIVRLDQKLQEWAADSAG